MADEKVTMERAQSLYDLKRYKEAAESCIELLKTGYDEADVHLLFAKSYLFMLTPALLEENRDSFIKFVGKAAARSKTPEEAMEIEYEVTTAIYQWEDQHIRQAIEGLVTTPTFDNWKAYFSKIPDYIMLRILTQVQIRNQPHVKAAAEEKGMKLGDYAEQLGRKAVPILTDEARDALEFDAACQIFANARDLVESEGNANGDYVKIVAKKGVEQLLLAGLIISHATPKEDANRDQVRRQYLEAQAQSLDYMLRALVYPNGQAMSLYHGDRSKEIENLKKIYSDIQKLDPFFEMPALPSVAAIDPPQQASGGCYVATAVYGSYDCPQVWTLRRFRDNILASTWYGRAFIRTYYAVSPTLVKWFGNTAWFKNLWRGKLDSLVCKLQTGGVESTPYEDRIW